jgi:hypothetical protein
VQMQGRRNGVGGEEGSKRSDARPSPICGLIGASADAGLFLLRPSAGHPPTSSRRLFEQGPSARNSILSHHCFKSESPLSCSTRTRAKRASRPTADATLSSKVEWEPTGSNQDIPWTRHDGRRPVEVSHCSSPLRSFSPSLLHPSSSPPTTLNTLAARLSRANFASLPNSTRSRYPRTITYNFALSR